MTMFFYRFFTDNEPSILRLKRLLIAAGVFTQVEVPMLMLISQSIKVKSFFQLYLCKEN